MKWERARTSAVVTWAGVQCVAVVTGAAGVRLWPHHPDPPQSLAMAELVGVQVLAAALLFPSLFGEASTAVLAIALLLPFDSLAGLVSADTPSAVLRSAAFVAVWVTGLAGWARLTRNRQSALWVVTAASLLTLGGAGLWYGRAERLAAEGVTSPPTAAYGPLLAGITLIRAPRAEGWTTAWAVVAAPAVLAVLTTTGCRILNRGEKSLHNSPQLPFRT